MAHIDKTASRLQRRYDLSNIEEFIAVMEGNNPFDYLEVYFHDQSYRKSEEELKQDQENEDGRYDRRALTLDSLLIVKNYNPEYEDKYISRGGYYATMDWPFVPKDKEVLKLDSNWSIKLSGWHSYIRTSVNEPRMNVSWVKDYDGENSQLSLGFGKQWEMLFPKEQLIYIYGCHQNAYDRGYSPKNYF